MGLVRATKSCRHCRELSHALIQSEDGSNQARMSEQSLSPLLKSYHWTQYTAFRVLLLRNSTRVERRLYRPNSYGTISTIR